jgi:ABC-2 type transport system permease protein
VHVSGLSIPLLLLAFLTQYAIPALTCIVAGDIFAAEDHLGTWQMILTRTPGRSAVFAAKALAAASFTVVMMAVTAVASTAAGLVIVGHQDLIGLSGTLIAPGDGARRVLLSWAIALGPALAFTAVGLLVSIATRSAAAGLIVPVAVGGLMQVYAMVGTVAPVRTALLATAFDAWHPVFEARPDYAAVPPALAVSGAYLVACVSLGLLLFRRRNFNQS